MTLWLILALMTAAAIFAVLWPLAQHRKAARSGSDIAVYRDQLEEVERDVAAGLIGRSEAEAARVEISRRLLAAADDAQATPAATDPKAALWRRRAVALVSLLLLPIGAGALYLRLGSPGLGSGPLVAQRTVAPDQASVESLVARVEDHLQRSPEDGRGWEVVAPVYMQLGRYNDSVLAWRNVLRLLGETADRQANLGEALMAQANGIVTADAKAAFVRAVALDHTTVSARFYLGVAAVQDGDRDKAAQIWRELIAEAPAGAAWVADVRAALARLDSKALPGPTPAEMAAAAKQSEQQDTMISGMVERLAAKLRKDGSNPDDWVRLVRSYKVLGAADKAQAAIADARKALAGDADKSQRLEAALKELDVEPSTSVAPGNPPAGPNAPPQHDDATIRNMVDRLAARLQQSGADPDGWLMLTRSYLSMGEKNKAAAAVQDARRALAADPAKLQQFDEGLQRFKIDESANAAPVAPPAPAPAEPSPSAQTNEIIHGMVDRLAERLKKDGSDFEGWMRLVRSYAVLGEREKALGAIADAHHAIGTDADKRRRFDDFVKSLGLGG